MIIVRLSDYPKYTNLVSSIIYTEFNKFYEDINIKSIKECEKMINNYNNRIFIALDKQNILMGFGSLEYNDGIKNEKYVKSKPWLTDLYIIPEYRNRGIGTAIIKHIISYAKHIGYNELFLWTNHEYLIDYYKNRGIEFLESIDENGIRIYIFKSVFEPEL